MRIVRIENPIANVNGASECWLTSNRKVMLQDRSIIAASDMIIGQHAWDMDGSYLGMCMELTDYKGE